MTCHGTEYQGGILKEKGGNVVFGTPPLMNATEAFVSVGLD